ncbi:MAG: GNAT family N-acetyltransferase, partial [Nocardioidaceae bacterium]
ASVSDAWLATDERAAAHLDDALAVLQGPDQVGFVEVGSPLVARGRVACAGDGAADWAADWAGITDVWVSPDHRRQGLGLVVLDALVEWAAERGATTAYLQVRADNAPARALYDALGFRTHHTYRYLAAPAGQ